MQWTDQRLLWIGRRIDRLSVGKYNYAFPFLLSIVIKPPIQIQDAMGERYHYVKSTNGMKLGASTSCSGKDVQVKSRNAVTF